MTQVSSDDFKGTEPSNSEEIRSKEKRKWLQRQLPLFSNDMILITNKIGVKQEDETIFYFNGCMPIFSHHKNDNDSFRMITAQFYVNGNATQREIINAFGISAISVKRAVKIYRTEGIKGFYKPRGQRGATVFNPEILKKAQDLLDEGETIKEAAATLNIKVDTFQKACLHGRLKVPDFKKKRI